MHEYLADFPDKPDVLRYALLTNLPEAKDSEFTWKEYQTRINSELADNLGNFVNRVTVLTQKYYGGIVPEPGQFTDEDLAVISEMNTFPSKIAELVYAYKLRDAQSEVMNLSRLGNKYLAEMEPWKMAKDPAMAERVQTIMYIALQITANLSIVLQPFLPATAKKISGFLNFVSRHWEDAGSENLLPSGHKLNESHVLFAKIEDSLVDAEVEKLNASKVVEPQFDPQKEDTTFDDFNKMDIRLGTILEAEKIENADKLLKLLVDTGLDKRTIVSGIAKHYSPEEVIGKTVTVLMNLSPRKIRGVESNGMILMAEDADGNLSFVSPEKGFQAGCGIR